MGKPPVKKKKEKSSYLDRRLKRLKNMAVLNNSDEPPATSEPLLKEGVASSIARVLMGRTENLVYEPFQQTQEVKVWNASCVYV